MSISTGNPAHVQQVEKLLKVMLDNGGAEVRLSAGVAPMVRIDGSLKPMGSKPLSADAVAALAAAVMPAGSDPARFSFDSALGSCAGTLVDVDGTKVLVLQASRSNSTSRMMPGRQPAEANRPMPSTCPRPPVARSRSTNS